MPLIDSPYYAPIHLPGGHIQSAFPHFRRSDATLRYDRERISTEDDDFLDLDWTIEGNKTLAILCHGLEGNSRRTYLTWMSKALLDAGSDTLAWNYRCCSGEPNRKIFSYHAGATYDLHTVVRHAQSKKRYTSIVLIGYSLGGNLVLKYLGERGRRLPNELVAGVTFSVPCDLASGAKVMALRSRRMYMDNFLTSLREKVRWKAAMFPGDVPLEGLDEIRTFAEFDERYVAPFNGFTSAEDYWKRASALGFISSISVPTLLVSARNDPFLAKKSFPVREARDSTYFFLEAPLTGGHVGFPNRSGRGLYWSDLRAVRFLREVGALPASAPARGSHLR